MGVANSKQEAFYDACGYGATHKVRKFIDEGINVNWVSYTHDSCAIHVASQGKHEIVKMLIEAKCDVNVLDNRGNLALHHAAMKGHGEIMQTLIDAGSHVDTQDMNGWTSLINAGYFCQPEAVEVLLKNKCDPHLMNKDERTALHETCRSQSEDHDGLEKIARQLIAAGSDINAKSSDLGEADFTPLMFTAYHGHLGVAQALIEAKCETNALGSNSWTALHWAADRGNKDVVELLLDTGLDPLAEGRRGELPLDRAQNNEIKEILRKATDEARAILGAAERELQDEKDSSEPKILAEAGEKEKEDASSVRSCSTTEDNEEDTDNTSSVSNSSAKSSVVGKEEMSSVASSSTGNKETEKEETSSFVSCSAGNSLSHKETESSESKDIDSSALEQDATEASQSDSVLFTPDEEQKGSEETPAPAGALAAVRVRNRSRKQVKVSNLFSPPDLPPDFQEETNLSENAIDREQSQTCLSTENAEPTGKADIAVETNEVNDVAMETKLEANQGCREGDQQNASSTVGDIADKLATVEIEKIPRTTVTTDDEDEELFDESAFNEGDYTDDLKDTLSE